MNDKLFKLIVYLGLIAVAVAPSNVFAQSCGPRRVVVTTPHVVHTPVVTPIVKEVVTPVAVPVLVPAFQFQYSPPCVTPGYAAAPAYGVPHGAGYAQPGYSAGYGAQGYAGAPGYGQGVPPMAQPGYQQGAAPQPGQPGESQQDMVRALAKALLEEMSRQSQAQAPAGGPPDAGPPAAPAPVGGPNPAPANPNPFPTALPNQFPAGPNGQALATFAYNATIKNCAACHTGIGSKGDTIIFSQPGVLNPAAPWKTMAKEVQEGRMPSRDSQYRLTPEEAQAILAWYTEMGRAGR